MRTLLDLIILTIVLWIALNVFKLFVVGLALIVFWAS